MSMLKKLITFALLIPFIQGSEKDKELTKIKKINNKKTITENALDLVTTIKPLQAIIQAYFSDWLEVERLKLRDEIFYFTHHPHVAANYKRYAQLFGQKALFHLTFTALHTTGHCSPYQYLSPDGTYIAVYRSDIPNTINIYAENSQKLSELYVENGNILPCGIDELMRQNLVKLMHTIEEPIERVESMSFSANNQFFAASINLPKNKIAIKVWDLKNLKLVFSYDDATSCKYVVCSPDGTRIGIKGKIGAMKNDKIFVFDIQANTLKSVINGDIGVVFSQNNNYCATISDYCISLLKETELEYEVIDKTGSA